jgi:hypothetical protein
VDGSRISLLEDSFIRVIYAFMAEDVAGRENGRG